jgi:hypothetical protein
MTDFQDYDLGKDRAASGLPPVKPPRTGLPWVIGGAVLAVLVAIVGYFALRPASPADTVVETSAPVVSAPAEPPPAPAPGADVVPALPPLEQMDPLVRRMVQELSSHPKVAAWLATDDLVENFALVALNLADGLSPAPQLRALQPGPDFAVIEANGTLFIDPASYRRYNDYADAVAALDARGVAELYTSIEPRVLDAARQLGYTRPDFDEVLERTIVELLRTPVFDTDVEVVARTVAYEYADPSLESLSAAQKHLLRMGPRNVRAIQAKLREIAAALGIPADRLPRPITP